MDVARRSADRWYVTTGHKAIGPVNLDLIARGVEAGKVPLEAFVRHEGWKVWRPLAELAEIIDDEGARPSTDDISELGRPSTPDDFLPADAIDGAGDRREAMALLMTAAVVRSGADVAIVHEVEDAGAVVVCAHGPQQHLVGARTPLLDPALIAAAAGATVVAEPAPGPAGQAMLARLAQLAGASLDGALMIPIRRDERLVGMIELGRAAPFRSAEIASVEALVDALVAKLAGWGI
ncbi:MAG: GYF domain-containing protein [Minicystis sp.]